MTMFRTSLLAAVLTTAGCGGGSASGALRPTFPDNRPDDLAAVLSRLASAPRAQDAPVAVGASASGELFAFDLANGRMLWKRPAEIRSGPFAAGDIVVTQETSGVVGRSLQNGEVLFEADDEAMHLIGASGEGSTAAALLSTGGGVGARSRLLSIEDGSIHWDAEFDQALGAPAVLGGMVFVPWSHQNLSVIDLHSGAELARIRITDAVISTAVTRGGALWVGQRGLFRVDRRMAAGTREGTSFFMPELGELPGRPSMLRDSYRPPPAPTSATHRIVLAFHPDATRQGVLFSNQTIFLVFYRLIFALDASGSGVRWAREHDRDIVGVSAQGDGLLVADEGGGLTFLGAADGRPTWSSNLGTPAVFVQLRAEGFGPSGEPSGAPMPLRDQLLAVAQSTDARLVPGRVLAVHYLAALPDADVTEGIMALCDQRGAPEAVHTAACDALGARTTGAEYILAGLQRHSAFLEGTTAPPVGPLARAAVAMHEDAAVPLLVAQLADPETPAADLPLLLDALAQLGDVDAAAPVRDFLLLYHADTPDENMVAALGAAVQTLVALQGPLARDLLVQVAADALSTAPIRGLAQRAVEAIDTEQAGAESADQQRNASADQASREEADAAERASQEAALPERITPQIAATVLAPVRRALIACLGQTEGHPRSARLIMRLHADGSVDRVSVTPTAAQACIEGLVRSRQWPANRRRTRQQVTYTLRR